MTKRNLIILSLARDLLDVLGVGMIPGVNWALNAPVIYCHYRYAGPAALLTLLENLPGVELLPMFTAAALAYPSEPASPSGTAMLPLAPALA